MGGTQPSTETGVRARFVLPLEKAQVPTEPELESRLPRTPEAHPQDLALVPPHTPPPRSPADGERQHGIGWTHFVFGSARG